MMFDSLNRGLDIMEYIVTNRCASVSEIAHIFGVNKSTASRILAVLANHNLVSKDECTKKYYSDIGTLLYSSRTISSYLILDVIHPLLHSLASRINMTTQVSVLKHRHVFIIDQVKGHVTRFLKEPAIPGMYEPFHCSAIGKCIMAFLPVDEYQTILKDYMLCKYTDNTITDKDTLCKELEIVRKNGYALDNAEFSPKVYCLAVPIYDKSENVSFSLGVSSTENFLKNDQLFNFVLNETKSVSKQISQKYSASDLQQNSL